MFIVSLTVSAEIGIACGVAASWFLTLGKSATTPAPVYVLKLNQPNEGSQRSDGNPEHSTALMNLPSSNALVDCSRSPQAGSVDVPDGRIVVLPFRAPLVFSTADQLKVCSHNITLRCVMLGWNHNDGVTLGLGVDRF